MLFRYVSFHYLKKMLIILMGLSGLFAGLDFLMNASSLSSFNVKVLYVFSKWQEALNLLYPLAIVFGGIWTKIAFVKQNAIASFYALGVTRKELFKPFLFVGILTYFVFLGLNFTPFAAAQDTARSLFKNQYSVSKTEDLFFKYNNSFVYIGALIPEQYKIENLTIFKMKNNEVIETFTAEEAWYNIYEWVATNAIKKSKVVHSSGHFRLDVQEIPVLHTLRDYQPKILESIYDGKSLTLYENFVAQKLLEAQGLNTYEVRADIYSKMVIPLFSIALLMILIFEFPFHARYMNIAITTTKAIGGTLFTWGILFALQGIAKNGSVLPEIVMIVPVVLLWVYALYVLSKAQNKI
jgi:lipopolysaccharide export system permease protein